MDIREPVVMSLKTWADCALEESLFESCKVARKAGLMNCWTGHGACDVESLHWDGGSGKWLQYWVVILD